MTTKVVFLDVDGPMIPVRAYFLPNQTPLVTVFDPCAVSMLNRILRKSKALLVISSLRGQDGKNKCKELLDLNNIQSSLLHDDWITPRISHDRAKQIADWLIIHPEITHYVAIDDEDLDMSVITNAVLCDTYEGFSHRNYLECLQFLDADLSGFPDRTAISITFAKRKSLLNTLRSGNPDKYKLEQLADDLFPLQK